jgi:hypothetical protein
MEDVEININDYVTASSEAAKRTRSVTIVLMTASVLMFSGFLNSLQSNWKLQRLRALENINSDYVKARLGPLPTPEDSANYSLYIDRYNQLYNGALKDYTDNVYTMRIPFFGIAIDINDLGSIGGLALVVILILYYASITREINNLRLSFKEAEAQGKLNSFYYLLAMRQVLTFPEMQGHRPSIFLVKVSKFLILIPMLIIWMIVSNDFYTLTGARYLRDSPQLVITLTQEALYAVIVFFITQMSVKKLIQIDRIWDNYWNKLNDPAHLSSSILPSERTKTYLTIPNPNVSPVAYIGSPRLAHPEQASDFEKVVVEESDDAGL